MRPLLLLTIILTGFIVKAQNDSTYKYRKDIYDIGRSIFKSRAQRKADSIAGKPPKIFWSILPGFGYAQQKGFSGVCTNNASFFTSKDSNIKISSVDFILEYTQFKQFLFPVISNIWLHNNRYNILGDWRYMKYSTKAYGLGGKTKNTEGELINYNFFRFYQLVMRRFAPDLLAGIGYNLDYHWDISSDRSNNGYINQEIRNYGLPSKTISSGITLNLMYDPRHNANNPTKGYFANLIYRVNNKLLASNSNWSSILIDLRKYITLPNNSRNVLAFWSYNWFTLNGNQPYFDLPGNGWDTKANTSRAYRQGRYTSKNMVYLESEYRFEITRNGLFAGVIFANMMYVSNKGNTQFDPMLPGAGCGIRMLTNKFSNTHLVLTYSVGKYGAQGFSFNLGEAF